jgi:hypothetical protein
LDIWARRNRKGLWQLQLSVACRVPISDYPIHVSAVELAIKEVKKLSPSEGIINLAGREPPQMPDDLVKRTAL